MPDIPEKNPRLQKLEEQRQQLREKQKQEREQLNARIRDERKRESDRQRALDRRRKIIAGALALKHMETSPHSDFAKILHRLLDEYVPRDDDRALFNLKPMPQNDNAQHPQSTAAHAKARMEQFAKENEAAG